MKCITLAFFIAGILFLTLLVQGQNAVNWDNSYIDTRRFIENRGQFDQWEEQVGSKILYTMDAESYQVFFTEDGVVYRLVKKTKNPNREEGDHSQPKFLYETDFVHIHWENANPDVQLKGAQPTADYHTYSMLKADRSGYYDIKGVRGFKTIIYEEVYPHIDVVFHLSSERRGFEYHFTLHPGADVTQIQRKFDAGRTITTDENGGLQVSTLFGNITESQPVSFYNYAEEELIGSAFQINGHRVSFQVQAYDNTKTLIIDPWVQMPSLGASSCIWECDTDSMGNVYVIGGEVPMRLQKYDSAGTLQWTYNTPWDTSNNWLGTLATDDVGNSYVTSGSVAAMQKVDAQGNMVWSREGYNNDEYWNIAFDCSQSLLIVGGTRIKVDTSMFDISGDGMVYLVEPDSGWVLDSIVVTKVYHEYVPPPVSITTKWPNEVRSICLGDDNNFYYLTFDTIGAVNLNNGLNLLFNDTVHHKSLQYKSENFRPYNGNSGIEAIATNGDYLYTQNGKQLYQRSLVDGSLLDSVTIPGGSYTSITPSSVQPDNMGIATDACGNVYVGSTIGVMKFDSSLSFVDSVHTPMVVYDVEISPDGDVIATGGTGDPNTFPRGGYVMSIDLSACTPYTVECGCGNTITPAGPFCVDDTSTTLFVDQKGGVYSGIGIIDTLAGVFDPSIAGVGQHLVTYRLNCNNVEDSMIIAVLDVAPAIMIAGDDTLALCHDDSITLIATGAQHYLWNTGDTASSIVVRSDGTYFVEGFNDASCQSMSGNVIISEIDTIFVNVITTQASSPSDSDGGIDVFVIQTAGPYSYLWSTGDTTQDLTNLAPGPYTVTITDGYGCEYVETFEVDARLGNGVGHIKGLAQFDLFPNPSDNIVYLELSLEQETSITIEWYDMSGKEISGKKVQEKTRHLVHMFDFSEHANGTYLLKITIGDDTFTRNVSIIR